MNEPFSTSSALFFRLINPSDFSLSRVYTVWPIHCCRK